MHINKAERLIMDILTELPEDQLINCLGSIINQTASSNNNIKKLVEILNVHDRMSLEKATPKDRQRFINNIRIEKYDD